METRKNNTDKPKGKTRKPNNPTMKGMRPFDKEHNGKSLSEKWTEDAVHSVLDELEDWLYSKTEIKDAEGNVVAYRDNNNVYYKDWLFEKKFYSTWINYVSDKFESVSKRFEELNSIQEQRLVSLATKGVTKEGFTKFMLVNKFNYSDKTETKNENTNQTTVIWNEEKSYNDGESII